MRNPDRIEPILRHLGEYWRTHPDMRLGQIIDNARAMAVIDPRTMPGPDVFYIEDEVLWAGITSLPDFPHEFKQAPSSKATE